MKNFPKKIPKDKRFSPFFSTELQINFHSACEQNNIELVNFFINNRLIPKNYLNEEVSNVIEAKNLQLLKILINNGAEMPYKATLYAVWTEDIEVINYILNYYTENPCYDANFCHKALCFAAEFSKNLSLIKFLVHKCPSIKSYCSALENAICMDSYEVANYLIKLGANLDTCAQGVIFTVMSSTEADKIHNAEKLNFLIDHGVSIEEIKMYTKILKSDYCCDDISIINFINQHNEKK